MPGPLSLPVVGVLFGRVDLEEVRAAVATTLYPLALSTDVIAFDFTRYYEKEMGPNLRRVWWAAAELRPAGVLAQDKLMAREIEFRWRDAAGNRTVNLDPGYIDATRFVVATTKALPQAIYLRDGIYAVLELLFYAGRFRTVPWTYADYAEGARAGRFLPFRKLYLSLMRATAESG